jgi:hypothetical protein
MKDTTYSVVKVPTDIILMFYLAKGKRKGNSYKFQRDCPEEIGQAY